MKILYLDSITTWENKTSRCRLDYQRALSKHPNLTIVNDGPGFPGFIDAVKSVEKHNPDLIMVFRPNGIPLLDQLPHIPKIISYNETDKHEQLAAQAIKYNICYHVFHHPGQINDLSQHLGHKHHKYTGILHAVDTDHYYGNPADRRDIDILITGCLSKEIYPFRHRLANLLKTSKFNDLKIVHYKHPGYRLTSVEDQRDMYCDFLRRAKLTIGCTSMYKYPLFKFIESSACGAIMAGDAPSFPQDYFSKITINLDPSLSDREIEFLLRDWISDNDKRKRKAASAQSLIFSTRTTKHYANEFVDALRQWNFIADQ